MTTTRRNAVALLAATALPRPLRAQAPFPEPGRPITVIVPYPPGGGSDITARALAPALEQELGTPVVIVNRAGAGSQIGMTQLAQARPDGYTLAYGLWPSTITLYLDASRGTAFTRDSFVPLAMHVIDPGVLIVAANSPMRGFADLVAAARARPDTITMADPGLLSWEHLSSVQIQQRLGLRFNQIHFQGAGPSVTALIAGQIDATMVAAGTATTQARAGQARPLAVLADRRSAFLPEVPTLAELGLPLNAGSARGFVAPSGTPAPVVARLAAALERAIAAPAHREQLQRLGLDTAFLNPAAFAEYWTREEAALRPVVAEVVRAGANN